jgi:PAS domain S-box-containing protein
MQTQQPAVSMGSISILIFESSSGLAESCLPQLRSQMPDIEADIVSAPLEFMECMDSRLYDLVLAESHASDWSVPDVLHWMKSKGYRTPLILITEAAADDLIAQCFDAGASDYVVKQDLGRLPLLTRRVLSDSKLRIDRDRAHQRLQDSEEQYRIFFESSPNPMWVCDMEDSRFLAVNDAAVRHYGYSRHDFLAMKMQDIHAEGSATWNLENVSTASPQSAGTRKVWRHMRKDRTVIDAEISSQPIVFRGRRATLFLVKDVTETRRLELQLQQAQKMEAIGQLAGGVAHDFNNLLMIVNSFAELILGAAGDASKVQNYATQIYEAGCKAAEVTRQLLAFSRAQVQDLRVLDLNTLVSNWRKVLPRVLGEDIAMTFSCANTPCLVRSDPSQLEQVIMNLVLNARDAMPRGGRLTITTERVHLDQSYFSPRGVPLRDGDYIMLSVSDTGCGMDDQTKSHIFEPFFTTKERSKGTGLGLATVYGIVKQHGGLIWVYSEVGQGSVFKVYLPQAHGAVDAPAKLPMSAEEPAGSERILVVEDESGIRDVICGYLRTKGYSVLQAANVGEALQVLGKSGTHLDLVLTDMIMPDGTGPDLAAAIQKEGRQLPMIFMSGYSDRSVDCGGHGAKRIYLQKPFSLSKLAGAVRASLEGQALTGMN